MTTQKQRPEAATLQDAIDEGIDAGIFARRWKILFTLCLSLMTVMLANSSINLALPALARDLQLSQLELTWVVEAYALVFASFLFIASAVADRYGRRRIMQIGLVVFTIAALYAGFVASSGGELIAARLLMGLGGAMVMPTTLSIVNVVFPRKERARAIAVWAGIAGAGIMFGSIISGLLLEYFSWEATFLFSGLVGVAAFVGNRIVVPESRDETEASVDWIGGLFATLGLGGVVYAIMEAPSHGLSDPLVMIGLIVGLVSLGAFVWWQLRTDHPLLDVRMFRAPSLGFSALAITLTFFALMGAFFGLSQVFQLVMGFSALATSFAFLPVMLPMIIISPFVPRVVARIGTKWTVAPGLALVAVGFILMANWPTVPSYGDVLGSMGLMVFGMVFAMTPATNMMMAAVPKHRSGMGSALNDTTRELGAALGIAVLGSMVSSGYTQNISAALTGLPAEVADIAGRSLGGAVAVAEQMGQAGEPLLAVAREAFMTANSAAMLIAAGIAFCASLIIAIGLPNRNTTDIAEEVAEAHHHGPVPTQIEPQEA